MTVSNASVELPAAPKLRHSATGAFLFPQHKTGLAGPYLPLTHEATKPLSCGRGGRSNALAIEEVCDPFRIWDFA